MGTTQTESWIARTSRNFPKENFQVSSDIGTMGVITRPHFLQKLHMKIRLSAAAAADSAPVADSPTALEQFSAGVRVVDKNDSGLERRFETSEVKERIANGHKHHEHAQRLPQICFRQQPNRIGT